METELTWWERIAEGVRMELAKQRLDQSALAREIGRSRNYVSLRVNGKAPFKLDEAEAVAAWLGVGMDELAGKVARS